MMELLSSQCERRTSETKPRNIWYCSAWEKFTGVLGRCTASTYKYIAMETEILSETKLYFYPNVWCYALILFLSKKVYIVVILHSLHKKFIIIYHKMGLHIHSKYMVFLRQLVETRNQFLDIIYYIYFCP